MKILLLGYFEDAQSALYVGEAFKKLGHEVIGVGAREIVTTYGSVEGQKKLLEEIYKNQFEPDVVLVLKGLSIKLSTLKALKERFSNAIFVNWFFDLYLHGILPWENKSYFDTLRFFDYYFCSLGGVADHLKEVGFKNVYYLDEAIGMGVTDGFQLLTCAWIAFKDEIASSLIDGINKYIS